MRTSIQAREPGGPDKVLVMHFLKDCGLGNQFFQLAAGLAIARRLNIELRWVYEPSIVREFGLEPFGLGQEEQPVCEVALYKVGKGSRAIVDQACESIIACKSKFVSVYSPFQAEECFESVADEVREIFKLDPLELEVPDGRTPVAIHVRRGDYVHHPWLQTTDIGYFRNAMDYMRRRVESPHFFIVSDDPDWVTAEFARDRDITVMPPQSAIDGLRVMAACKAHIISNSTYGWWGAWLAEDGPVVAPALWHKHDYFDWRPVPERWHRVSNEPMAKPNLTASVETIIGWDLDRVILYPWKATAEKWNELRISIRSVEKFFADKDVQIVILGTERPGWLLFNEARVHYVNTFSYADALATGLRMAKKCLFMNDDICMLKPTTWADCEKPMHLGPIRDDFLANVKPTNNGWKVGVERVVAQLKEMGHEELFVYSTHTGYVFERDKALDILATFGVSEKFPMELAYYQTHPEGSHGMPEGVQTKSAPFGDARWLNYTNDLLVPELKAALLELLPDYAPWELKRALRP